MYLRCSFRSSCAFGPGRGVLISGRLIGGYSKEVKGNIWVIARIIKAVERFRRLYRLNLFLVLAIAILPSPAVVYILHAKGYTLLVPVYLTAILLAILWSRPWDEKTFAWYLERNNPHLKERLISLYELLKRGVAHPSLERLKSELASQKLSYRPPVRALVLPIVLSAAFASVSLVRFPEKPIAIFEPPELSLLEGDSIAICILRRGDTLVVRLGEGEADNPSPFSVRTVGRGDLEIDPKGEGCGLLKGLDAGDHTLGVRGFRGKARLKVLPHPVLYSVEGYVVPPPYTGLSRTPLSRENVAYENSRLEGLRISHNGDSARFVNLPEVLKEDVEVLVEVFRGGRPFRYRAFSVKVIEDMPPSISLNPTGIVRAEGDVPATLSAYDDISLKAVGLRIWQGGEWREDVLGPEERVPNVSYSLKFAEETLKVVGFAVDVAGQVSYSDTLLVLPRAPEEILREKLLGRTSERVKDLERRLKEIEEMLEVSDNLSENTRAEISQTLKQAEGTYREINEALERLANQMRDPEIARMVMEIRRLFKEVMDEDLQRALEELQRAMEESDPKKVAEALRRMRMDQRKLKETLERTKALLERYMEEKRFREFSERLENLALRQREMVGERSEYQQAKLRSELEELQRELDSLKRIGDVDREKLSEVERHMKQALKSMEEAIGRMRSGGDFKKSQANAGEHLERAAELALQAYQEMRERRLTEIVQRLNRIGDAATFMDQRLERDADTSSLKAATSALIQMESDLRDLSRKNVYVSPKMAELAREAREKLEDALRKMEGNDKEGAKADIKSAQSALRMLSIMASSSAQACQNAGGSTGLASYMRQLARMAGEQRSISQQLSEGMSQDVLAEMLARQMALRKALEGTLRGLRERGAPSDALQELERALQEMEELEREMRSPDALQRIKSLRERANRITIRLLQARKALRRQRTEMKYEAQRPKPYEITQQRTGRVIDRRLMFQIYREYSRRLPPHQRAVYERYFEELLR